MFILSESQLVFADWRLWIKKRHVLFILLQSRATKQRDRLPLRAERSKSGYSAELSDQNRKFSIYTRAGQAGKRGRSDILGTRSCPLRSQHCSNYHLPRAFSASSRSRTFGCVSKQSFLHWVAFHNTLKRTNPPTSLVLWMVVWGSLKSTEYLFSCSD